MKILFDQGTPVPLKNFLENHSVKTAYELSWQHLENGDLIAAAETEGFDLMITTDQNLRYQQNLSERKLAILVLKSTSWPHIKQHVEIILSHIELANSVSYQEISIP